jgi:hypothetical protein
MPIDHQPTILCLASEFKGLPFLQEIKRLGGRLVLVTREGVAGEPWPHEILDTFFTMPDLYTQPNITYAVSYLARSHQIDRIVALDDYDVATAAGLREHMRLPGMNESTARHFRDKLAMRTRARQAGLPVPDFTGLFNYDQLRDFMARTPAPWVLKPRFEAGSTGIHKMGDSEAVWRKLDELGDSQSYFLLEEFLPGDVFHVDSIIWDGEPLFARASRYGAPPLSVTQGGGLFVTRTLDQSGETHKALVEANAAVMRGLGHERGVAHTEFIRAQKDGRFYFLETAARVGGANIDKMIKAATGIELWAEAARITMADIQGSSYELPDHRQEYAGLIICLARQEHPDLSAYTEPEIVWRLDKLYHAGLLVASAGAARVEELLAGYHGRFSQDFLHHVPSTRETRTTF